MSSNLTKRFAGLYTKAIKSKDDILLPESLFCFVNNMLGKNTCERLYRMVTVLNPNNS